MQISNQNNRVNFTSTPIHSVNLKKATNAVDGGFVKAVFSRLNPKDTQGDCLAVEGIRNTWTATSLRENFAGAFKFFKKESNHYDAIELVGNQNLAERIVCLAKSSIEPGQKLKMSLVLTKPEYFKNNNKRTIKDIGELMLGEIFNKAQALNVPKLEFESAEDGFYLHIFKKAGIEITPEKYDPLHHKFCIPEGDFNQYINYCQNEFKTNFSATI